MSQLRSLLPYFRPYRASLILGLMLVVTANAFTLIAPWVIKVAIDALTSEGVTPRRITGLASLIVVAALLGGAARYGMRELLNGISRRIECDLRNDFLRHLLRLDASFYGKIRTGDLMTRASQDTLAVRMAVGPGIMYSVNTVVSFGFAIGLMIWIDPLLTGLALIPMLALPPIVIGFGRVIHRRFEKIQEQFSAVSTMVQENLTGVRIVRAYTEEERQARDFSDLNREYMRRNMGLARVSGALHPLLGLFAGAAMVVVLWGGGNQIIAGRMTPGDLVAFIFYLGFLIWPLIALGWVVNLFQRGEASMGRLNLILETQPAIADPPDPLEAPAYPAAIEFRDVSFHYPGTERLVLDRVSFAVRPGQTVALVGPTGSGKTTLVSLLPRLYDPTGGEILLAGEPLHRYGLKSLRALIGMVPQDPFLFSTTIAKNIGLGVHSEGPSEEAVAGRILAATRTAQLEESIAGFPRGMETELGERGINLSGGQKQRATLARALARDPQILVLDDALSSVDTHTEARILSGLREVMAARTSFIISHRVSAVMDADLILVLSDGRIVERGRHTDLVSLGGVYARLLRRQMLEQNLDPAG